MKKSIYYAISNNGDGSASVHFFEDELCAEVFESLQSEPFAECTVREFDPKDVQTRKSMIEDLENDEYYSSDESQIEEAIAKLKSK